MLEENKKETDEIKLVPYTSRKILLLIIALILPSLFSWALFNFWNESLSVKIIFSLFVLICLSFSILGIRLAFSVYIKFDDKNGLAYYNSFTKKTISISELCSCSKTENGLLVFYKKATDTKETLPYASFSNYFKNLDLLEEWVSKHSLVSQPMDEDQFWKIIALSVENTKTPDKQLYYIVEKLAELPFKSIVSFTMRIHALLFKSYNEKLWCAAYLINSGSSDDNFEYFRLWLISRGKEAFYSALNNPDSIIDFIPEDFDSAYGLESEELWYAADIVFHDKVEVDDYIDYDTFALDEANYPEFEFTWNDTKPETMKAICPKLYNRFWS